MKPNTNNQENEHEKSNNNKKSLIDLGKRILAITLAAGTVFAAGKTLEHESHGADSPEKFGHLDTKIQAVVLKGVGEHSDKIGTRLRFDPNRGDSDNLNIIDELKVDNDITITTSEGAYITGDNSTLEEDNPNGSYVGVNEKDLKEAIPGFNIKGDNDGTVWVNINPERVTIIRKE